MSKPVGTLGRPSILGAAGSNPFLPKSATTVAKAAAPVIAAAPAKTPAASLVPQTPVIPAAPVQQPPVVPAAPSTALVVANPASTALVATGPSTGRKVVDIACAVYNHLPSGSTLAAAGAAAGYQFSGPAVAVAGAVVGFALPYIVKTATVKLAPNTAYATQLTHQPKVVQGLTQAGLENTDLVHIDVTALTAKMAKMTDADRKVFFEALAILKGNNMLNATTAKAVIDSPKPMELIQAMVAQGTVFAAVLCRNAIASSKNPQAMAKTFDLLMTVQIWDKPGNLAFVVSRDPVALESIVTTLATAGVLNEAMFEKVKASKDLQALADGLKKLETAGLLKKDKPMFGTTPGLLEGITHKGTTNRGECFLAVMDAAQPAAMASGLVELENEKILGHRDSFQAVLSSTDPRNAGIAMAQYHRIDPLVDSNESKAVRSYHTPRVLASILTSLNEASPKSGPHLLIPAAFNALMDYKMGEPVFLAKAIEELKNAKILDADTLKAVILSDQPLALAKLCCVLQEINYFSKAHINSLPPKKADSAVALKILKDAGVLSPSQTAADKQIIVEAIFTHLTPVDEAKKTAQVYKEDQERQAKARLASVKAAVVPAAPVAVSPPVIVGTPVAVTLREAAVLAATNALTAAGITNPAYVEAATASALPERMAAAIVRLHELGGLNDANVGILKAQDATTKDLNTFAESLALI